MTVHFAPQASPDNSASVSRLDAYLATSRFEKPTLVLDLDRVQTQFLAVKAGLGRAQIYYAVKANPAPQIISRMVDLGSRFDAASSADIALCLAQGAQPSDISFGNTIKRASDIAWAAGQGIALFAADAEEELEKIAQNVRLIRETPEQPIV